MESKDLSNFQICSGHFKPSDYIEPRAFELGNRLALKRGSVPSIFAVHDRSSKSKNSSVSKVTKMCFAPNCKHYSERQKCNFFMFPADPAERRNWINLLRRKDRDPSRYSRVCSCHFKDSSRQNWPTIFEHNSDAVIQTSSSLTDSKISTSVFDLGPVSQDPLSSVVKLEQEEEIHTSDTFAQPSSSLTDSIISTNVFDLNPMSQNHFSSVVKLEQEEEIPTSDTFAQTSTLLADSKTSPTVFDLDPLNQNPLSGVVKLEQEEEIQIRPEFAQSCGALTDSNKSISLFDSDPMSQISISSVVKLEEDLEQGQEIQTITRDTSPSAIDIKTECVFFIENDKIILNETIVEPTKKKRRKLIRKHYVGDFTRDGLLKSRGYKKAFQAARVKIAEQKRQMERYKKQITRLKCEVKDLTASLRPSLKTDEANMGPVCPASSRDLIDILIKGCKNEKFTPGEREFALTLHFYSPRAYNYVRQQYNKALPDTTTITKWYQESINHSEKSVMP
ncbi:uncharacterized protein LOC115876343 isoform X2 [Sitophilus oryzae]|nr:uncharacterized protein LOC115876343 isoform X2 [Sitophilus oryzae]